MQINTDLIVIEDACQAHGAEYFSRKLNRWMRAGTMGRAAAFSFYPGKNLGACGEGGAVTTNDDQLAERIRMLRDHGQVRKYYHDIEGYNGRLHALQAGILSAKLPHLGKWNSDRRERASEYSKLLANDEALGLPYEPSWSRAVYHLYVIRTEERVELIKHLNEAGIGTGIHYPIPLHLQKAYASMNYGPGDFPVSERMAAEIVSLPMFPQLTPEQQARVVEEVLKFTSKTGHRQQAELQEVLWLRPSKIHTFPSFFEFVRTHSLFVEMVDRVLIRCILRQLSRMVSTCVKFCSNVAGDSSHIRRVKSIDAKVVPYGGCLIRGY